MTCIVSRTYKLIILLSAPTLLTAAVICVHTSAFRCHLTLFMLLSRIYLVLYASNVMVSILASEKFLFLLDFCISMLVSKP